MRTLTTNNKHPTQVEKMTPNFLAIDPSLTATGWATNNQHRQTISGVITPKTRHGNRTHTLKGEQRLDAIARAITKLALHHNALFVAIEDYAYSSHSRAVTKLAELGGVIRTTLWHSNIPWTAISSSSIKLYATGKGNADKQTVLTAAQNDLNYQGTSHDEADALWLHALVSDAQGMPRIKLDPYDRRRNALDAVLGQLDTIRSTQ